jgi:DNA-binding transcriptional regulator YhcF (GntR family)
MTSVAALPDLVDRSALYERIADHYRAAILDGRLRPGDELPANRRMARAWRISPTTARKITTLLMAEGLILTRAGKAPIVLTR